MRGAAGEAIIVAVGLVFAYLVVRMSSIVATGAFNDDAIYISVGKALAAHEGYRSIYAAGAPVHMKYPPGLPALYAVLWRLGGTLGSVELLAINLALLVNGAAAALIWHVGRVRLRLSPPLVLLFAISPFLLESSIQYLNLAVSEPYFVLGWAAALVLGYRLEDALSGWRQIALAAGLGALVAGTTLIRWQAITLFALHSRAGDPADRPARDRGLRRVGADAAGLVGPGPPATGGPWARVQPTGRSSLSGLDTVG
jgi:hypothetical protein